MLMLLMMMACLLIGYTLAQPDSQVPEETFFSQFYCGSGYFNPTATVTFAPSEVRRPALALCCDALSTISPVQEAIKTLFHGVGYSFNVWKLLAVWLFYTVMTCWTYGKEQHPLLLPQPLFSGGCTRSSYSQRFVHSLLAGRCCVWPRIWGNPSPH